MCLFIYGYFKVLGKFIVSFFEYLYNNSLKRYFTNIRGLCSNFVGCKSFLEWKCLHFLALCEINLNESIDSGNFSVTCYLPLIWKDSVTYMYGLAVYKKEGIPFERDLSLQNSQDSYYVLCWFCFIHFYFFSLYRLHSCSLCTIFRAISPEIDEVLSINPSPNVFAFEDFTVHHKKWLTTLLTWLSFPLRSLTVTLRFRLIWVCSSF